MLLLSAESLCLVDRKHNIIQPIIPEELEFMHLWCYLFYRLLTPPARGGKAKGGKASRTS